MTAITSTTPRHIHPEQQLEVDSLRAVITAELANLAIEIDLLGSLALAPRQQKNLLMSASAKAEQDEMMRKSKKELLLQRARGVNPPVISRPPAPVSIIDLKAQISIALIAHETRAWRILHAVPARTRQLDLTDQQRLGQLQLLVSQVWDSTWLVEVETDLMRLVELSKALHDGEPKGRMDAACPWCGRRTLIVYKNQGLIVCEDDDKSGHRETCICSAGDDCGCTRGKRHSWKRSDGGFERLAAMLLRAKS